LDKIIRKKKFCRLLIWLAILGSLGLLVEIAPILYSPDYIRIDDFGHFWASGKLFISHGNPYDLDTLESMQLDAGAEKISQNSITPQTLNPPWVLLIFSPFSLLRYSTARILWLMSNISVIVISVRFLWIILHGSINKQGLALLVTFCFTPVYSVLTKGQVTPWVVIGITLVLLYSEGITNSWWAGIGLLLISIKPQLFYLIWPAMAFWVIHEHRWHLVITTCFVGIIFITATITINSQIFSNYYVALLEYPYDQWATPTIGSYLRFFWLGVDKFWVQYIPTLLGFVWLILHFCKNRMNWNWHDQIPILTIISLLTTPYAWTYDAIIILPAILVATSILIKQNKNINFIFWAIFFMINLTNLLLHSQMSDFWFLWLVPAYYLWYIIIHIFVTAQSKKNLENTTRIAV
jgi:hypothetical protein